MALQLSVAARNALLDAIETTIGTAPYLDIRTGAQPADCAQADAGTELEHMALLLPVRQGTSASRTRRTPTATCRAV